LFVPARRTRRVRMKDRREKTAGRKLRRGCLAAIVVVDARDRPVDASDLE
jgi:hypothetical protein